MGFKGSYSRTTASLIATVVFSCFGSAILPGRAAEPITVVSYNLKNYLAMDRRVDGETLEDAPKPEREIKAIVAAILEMKPDILSVCEIGDATFLKDLRDRLKAGGLDLPHSELVTAASGYNRNLGLLSRFPIAGRHSRDDYTYLLDGEKLPFQRGVLDVDIAITPEYRLRYVGLHLKSKREVPNADQAMMRLNEARLARKHIDQIFEKDPDVNLLVTGDFNDLRIEPPVKALQSGFTRAGYLASLTLEDRYGFRWTHHWSFADSYSRFDYALYSKGLSPEIQRDLSHIYHWPDWDKASDHRPLVIRITPEDRDSKFK
ncbi:endonuclease/exonuclease/phosphatase family protein [Verrucomicrobiales bacterium BCK34]|nr:endonuclease/exonuclease/phosphatase family protein [Verrucomicrobiales bacterium BCK34]